METLEQKDVQVTNCGETGLIQNQDEKTCKTCGETLPIEKFALRKRFNGAGTSYYREGSCRKCVGKKKKKYLDNMSPEKKEEYNKKRREAAQKRLANLSEEEKNALKERNKQYRENLPEWKKEERKLMAEIKAKENRRRWIKIKEQEGCFHCHGENLGKEASAFGEAYDSHHVHIDKATDSKGNTVELSSMISGGYDWDTYIQPELDKTVVLCKFCHSQWHSKNLYINFSSWKNYDPTKPLKI